jgi:hypothetical protein
LKRLIFWLFPFLKFDQLFQTFYPQYYQLSKEITAKQKAWMKFLSSNHFLINTLLISKFINFSKHEWNLLFNFFFRSEKIN